MQCALYCRVEGRDVARSGRLVGDVQGRLGAPHRSREESLGDAHRTPSANPPDVEPGELGRGARLLDGRTESGRHAHPRELEVHPSSFIAVLRRRQDGLGAVDGEVGLLDAEANVERLRLRGALLCADERIGSGHLGGDASEVENFLGQAKPGEGGRLGTPTGTGASDGGVPPMRGVGTSGSFR